MWKLLKKKDVLDVDGFWTEYTMYTDGERYVCIFGDSEIYTPETADWDFETESVFEAVEWFDNYGCDDEEEEEYDNWYCEGPSWSDYEDDDAIIAAGWAQQDVLDMYRGER